MIKYKHSQTIQVFINAIVENKRPSPEMLDKL